MVLQYGDSGRSFPKDSSFACKIKKCLVDKSKNTYV